MGWKARKRELHPARILVIGFAALIAAGGLLLCLPAASASGVSIGPLAAFFTATSATCVTGLTVIVPGEDLSLFGQLVMLFLIQAGGLGFMTLGTLLFAVLRRRMSLNEQLTLQESLNEDRAQGISQLALSVVRLTFIIELAGAALFACRLVPAYGWGRGLYLSLFHAVSAFCNAGFDLFGADSLIPFAEDALVNATVMLLIILGGLGFTVLLELLHLRRHRRLSLHSRLALAATGGLLVFGFLFFLLVEWNNPATLGALSPGGRVMGAAFQSVTCRTAGFNTIPQAPLTAPSKLMSCILMFIGACPGSTGGGVKATTTAVVMLLLISTVKGDEDPRLFRHRLGLNLVRRALAIVVISVLLVLAVTMALCLLESDTIPFLDLLYETISAFGTVGLGLGNTPGLSAVSKLCLMATMFAGRLGPMTLMLAIARRQARTGRGPKFPEGRIMVG
jgi:trk system potassium uptake protein TrkH